ncbi:MAG: GNAT family N-acetyltransferase [Chloroflexota bacterium]|nr:GNAT family N-acetyltransferase [Chloroflexota bacterium]
MIHLREAMRVDAAAIARLHLANWRTAYRGIVPNDLLDAITVESRRQHWETVLTEPDGAEFAFVAEDADGRLLGIASGGPEIGGDPQYHGELYVLHVGSDAQGHGVGRALMRAVAERLAEDGITTLLVWMLRENHAARRFYAALGGQFIREQPALFEGVMLMDVGYGWLDTATLRQLKEA